ncbi:ATP-dependent DNA helicase DDX11 [Tanacetum coccineum]
MVMESKVEMGEEKFGGFPLEPYSIQIDFMNALYDSLDKGGIAMLESPTGTGKTLSIICSALQWLVDRKQRKNNDSLADTNQVGTSGDHVGSDDEPDWFKSVLGNKEVESPKKKVKKQNGFRSKKRDKTGIEESLKDLFNHFREMGDDYNIHGDEQSNVIVKSDGQKLDDKEFLVDEYESEDEKIGRSKRKGGGVCGGSSSSEGEEEGDEFSDEEEEADLKIYFCSRTHSQLSQFVKELKKTVFADEIKVASLGSRKNLCINEEVIKLGNSTLINERCLDLQKNKKNQVSKMKNSDAGGRVRKTKASGGCPMLSKQKLQKQFKNEMTDQGPLDIEDLVRLGGTLGTCPYYGSRSMVPAADLVVLPYQSLLSKSSRESLGLSLKNSVVIIDEAHNLADSLISMYDSKITLSQLELVNSSLEGYFQRFRNLLGPGNRRHIQTLMILTRAFIQALCNKDNATLVDSSVNEELPAAKSGSDCSLRINEFVFSLDIDNINLVKLLQYIKDSNMIHKVSGYGDKLLSLQNNTTSILSSFRALAGMLLSLTNGDSDGRIILSRKKPTDSGQHGGYIKYVMLTGEKIFHEIVTEAHAVVLAGGTLQPIEETRARLFPWLLPDQLQFFSCGHIISSDNILPISVSHGPSGQSLDFSYSSRSTSAMVGELGALLCNLVTVVPQGIVVFFSSFDYEECVYTAWKASGVLGRIMKKKRVFREPRKSTEIEVVLKEYKESIDASSTAKDVSGAHTGAVLFAVVGGKISEGINFSDGMGRCIVMVGLPYPSPSDIELMERVKHIDGLGDVPKNTNGACFNGDAQAGFDILRSCKNRGREYYENLCMKAVNQSIGRAIRHINDYAAILLVDTRYTTDSFKKNFSHPTDKLPSWIKDRLVSKTSNYGEVHRLLHQFFKFHKSK